jgi:tetratricopeptide (TPR) repeat protein
MGAKRTGEEIAWTDPYPDASGLGRMITCAKAVYRGSELVGVVAVDITINDIIENILDVTLGKTGYAVLLDSNDEVVASGGTWSTLEKGAFSGFKGSGPGIREVDEKYYSYIPIQSVDLSLVLVVPVDEIVAPIEVAESEIDSESSAALTNFIIITIIFIVVVVVIGMTLSSRLVRPIKQLTQAADLISGGNYNADVAVTSKDEIAVLADSFKNILTTLRLGNRSYYKGDLQKALDNYRDAMVLFETTGNQKGIGMCLNNIGNIYRTWGQYALASDYIKKSIDIAKKHEDKAALAMRYNNMGILMRVQGNNKAALSYYAEALKLSHELDDHQAISMRLNNIGLIHLDTDVEKAIQHFSKAFNIDKEYSNKRGMGNSLNNLGMAFLKTHDFDKAIKYLQPAVDIGQELGDPKILCTSLQLIAEYHHGKGATELEKASMESADEVRRFGKPAKTVIFVVDKSGSMTADRINAVREGATELFDRKIYNKDKVGIIEFDDDPNIVSQPLAVEKNRKKIKQGILSITPNPPFGLTAFFDAVGDACKMLSNSAAEDMRWIVALTDGADNQSEFYAARTEAAFGGRVKRLGLRDYMNQLALDATVVVLGAGEEVDEVEQDLKFLCEEGGYYIKIPLGKDAKKAIRRAFKDVERLFAEQEEIEGFDISEM